MRGKGWVIGNAIPAGVVELAYEIKQEDKDDECRYIPHTFSKLNMYPPILIEEQRIYAQEDKHDECRCIPHRYP